MSEQRDITDRLIDTAVATGTLNQLLGRQISQSALDTWHRLWYGPFVWGDGSKHPCPVDGSLHDDERSEPSRSLPA